MSWLIRWDEQTETCDVGFFTFLGVWEVWESHKHKEDAEAQVNYLNGGTGAPEVDE